LDEDPDEVESDEFLERLAQNLGKPLSHPMVPRATRTLFSLFPIFRGENRININDVPPDIFGPARSFLLDAHTHNLPIQILPDNPLGALAHYLATTYPTRAGPAP
jgi:hypothetical protein